MRAATNDLTWKRLNNKNAFAMVSCLWLDNWVKYVDSLSEFSVTSTVFVGIIDKTQWRLLFVGHTDIKQTI